MDSNTKLFIKAVTSIVSRHLRDISEQMANAKNSREYDRLDHRRACLLKVLDFTKASDSSFENGKRFLVTTTGGFSPFYVDHIDSIDIGVGVVVYDLVFDTFSTDGKTWKKLPQ